ncbi:hypothetical protein bthur0001_56340 [Bacillus thuringiensis serovar tochigiensis BGSC 4Y1]|nr:hypothetical protein bthur0001_56340 [Bacillus thuringiensis serovar tochigiensis BGSC 4Y1]
MKTQQSKERAKGKFLALCDLEGYKIIGEYINNRTKIQLICPTGHNWKVRPYSFSYLSSRCAICNKQSPQESKRAFFELCKSEGYEVLSEYINNKIKVKVLCPLKHEFETSPANFKKIKNKCPKCYNRGAKKKWEELMKCSRYTALSEYKNSNEKVLVRCNWCGKEFLQNHKGYIRIGGVHNVVGMIGKQLGRIFIGNFSLII